MLLAIITACIGIPGTANPRDTVLGWFSLAEATQLRLADPGYPMLFERFLDAG